RSVTKAEALAMYKDNEYKTELIENLEDGTITFCDHDNFTDLCRGGHIPDTGIIKAVKILNVAGAYWRGDEKNKQLTRVYGISFPKQKELKEYLELLEEAKKRPPEIRKRTRIIPLFTACRTRITFVAAKRSCIERPFGTIPEKSSTKSRLRASGHSTYRTKRTIRNIWTLCQIR